MAKDALRAARKAARRKDWPAAQAWALIGLLEAQHVSATLQQAVSTLERAQALYDRTPAPDDPRLWLMPASPDKSQA